MRLIPLLFSLFSKRLIRLKWGFISSLFELFLYQLYSSTYGTSPKSYEIYELIIRIQFLRKHSLHRHDRRSLFWVLRVCLRLGLMYFRYSLPLHHELVRLINKIINSFLCHIKYQLHSKTVHGQCQNNDDHVTLVRGRTPLYCLNLGSYNLQ